MIPNQLNLEQHYDEMVEAELHAIIDDHVRRATTDTAMLEATRRLLEPELFPDEAE